MYFPWIRTQKILIVVAYLIAFDLCDLLFNFSCWLSFTGQTILQFITNSKCFVPLMVPPKNINVGTEILGVPLPGQQLFHPADACKPLIFFSRKVTQQRGQGYCIAVIMCPIFRQKLIAPTHKILNSI